ncbi:MAG: hypothetical protein PHV10_04355 [Sulfuricurvum sp.]|nr:hypothetical protein [Sulfuricurvum sp.]
MTPEQSNIAMLSLFYWGLSVLMLRVVVTEKRMLLYTLSTAYLALNILAGWSTQWKWVLLGSLIFMVIAMSYTLWILWKQSRECIRELKQAREEEKQ